MKLKGLHVEQKTIVNLLYLQALYMMFSIASVTGKIASRYDFLSPKYLVWYGTVLAILIVYSFFWQKILKQVSLMVAYANRGSVVWWNLLWSALLFKERVTFFNILGAGVIVIGIMLVSHNE